MRYTIIAAVALALASCSDMTPTQQRAASGTLIGAGAGTIIGAIGGNAGMGAAVGAGVGLAGGLIHDKVERDKEAAYRKGVQDGRRTN